MNNPAIKRQPVFVRIDGEHRQSRVGFHVHFSDVVQIEAGTRMSVGIQRLPFGEPHDGWGSFDCRDLPSRS